MGLNLKWDITYKCNLNCGHCVNASLLNNKAEEMSIDDIRTVVSKLKEVDINYIHLLGGEPIFRKDFYEIAECFKENKIHFGFNTNGLKLNSDVIKQVAKNEYLKSVILSLEGPTAEINDNIRGKNVFNVSVPRLKELIKYKKDNNLNQFDITINTVVNTANYDYIIDMIDFCIDLGVDKLNLLEFVDEGNAADKKNLLLSDEQELELVKKIALKYPSVKDNLGIIPKFVRPIAYDYCKKYLKLDFPFYAHGCGAGTKFGFLDNKGNLYPCDRYRPIMIADGENIQDYSLLTHSFMEVWGKSYFNEPYKFSEGIEFYKKYEPCNKCDYLRKSCFPCIVYGRNGNKVNPHKCNKYFDIMRKEGIINE